jgi:hypothetical protein
MELHSLEFIQLSPQVVLSQSRLSPVDVVVNHKKNFEFNVLHNGGQKSA